MHAGGGWRGFFSGGRDSVRRMACEGVRRVARADGSQHGEADEAEDNEEREGGEDAFLQRGDGEGHAMGVGEVL